MKNIQVKPLETVNGIEFGSNREKVRELFGDYTEFKKSKFSKNTTDDFGYCHVFYNLQNECEAFEFFGDDIIVSVENQQFYPSTISNIKNVLQDLKEEAGSLICKKLSIGITTDNGKVESILFGNKGYYE